MGEVPKENPSARPGPLSTAPVPGLMGAGAPPRGDVRQDAQRRGPDGRALVLEPRLEDLAATGGGAVDAKAAALELVLLRL